MVNLVAPFGTIKVLLVELAEIVVYPAVRPVVVLGGKVV
jgi:hypothetical protein